MSWEGVRGLTLVQVVEEVAKGGLSVYEVAQAYVEAIEGGGALNAYVHVDGERVLAQAKARDEARGRGEKGLLDGVMLGVKDMFCTKGIPTTACSQILKDFVPTYESGVTERLWAAGAVCLGKTNHDEFAMGASGEHSVWGTAVNPWREEGGEPLVAGGSSSGSAVAVAAGLCGGALGTDTGGSVRLPGAFTGTVAMRPTYGRCSRWGVVAFASSLDQAGPMTRTVDDAALLLDAMVGFDVRDSTSAQRTDRITVPLEDIKGLRVGIVPAHGEMEGMGGGVGGGMGGGVGGGVGAALWQEGMAFLVSAGAEQVEVALKHAPYGLQAYHIGSAAEAASNLARYDGVRYGAREASEDVESVYVNTRTKGFGDEVRRRILMGTYVLSAGYYDAYYVRARKARALISYDYEQVFEKVDVVLTPVSLQGAFPIGSVQDPVAMYAQDAFTVDASLAGLPALTVPCGVDARGLPMGLQVVGKKWEEGKVLQVGKVLEGMRGYHAPPCWW